MFNKANQALHILFSARLSGLKFCFQESSLQNQPHWSVFVCPSTKPLNEKFSLPKMFFLTLPKLPLFHQVHLHSTLSPQLNGLLKKPQPTSLLVQTIFRVWLKAAFTPTFQAVLSCNFTLYYNCYHYHLNNGNPPSTN